MAKSTRKKPTAAAQKSVHASPATGLPAGKQPQSKQQAANQVGMFLHTDDAWSLAYFDGNDLHHLERELFGKAN
jgi:hypothetical protein